MFFSFSHATFFSSYLFTFSFYLFFSFSPDLYLPSYLMSFDSHPGFNWNQPIGAPYPYGAKTPTRSISREPSVLPRHRQAQNNELDELYTTTPVPTQKTRNHTFPRPSISTFSPFFSLFPLKNLENLTPRGIHTIGANATGAKHTLIASPPALTQNTNLI